jgi:hypothetical protein
MPMGPIYSAGPTFTPRQRYRTGSRTSARTEAWGGTGSAYDSKLKAPASPLPFSPPILTPSFIVITTGGKRIQIADYEDTDEGYRVVTLNGGKMLMDRATVDRIVPIEPK